MIGSSEMFADEWLDKEENAKVADMVFKVRKRTQFIYTYSRRGD